MNHKNYNEKPALHTSGEFHIDIMPMTPARIPQAAAIEAEVFSMPWSEKGFADALAMENALFYTALVNGCVAGYCGIYLAADEGEITNVAVAPAYRCRKIAERLVRTTLPEAHAKGAQRIFLEVRESNGAAIRLYEKTGFHTVGRRKNFYQYPNEDALVMRYDFADK